MKLLILILLLCTVLLVCQHEPPCSVVEKFTNAIVFYDKDWDTGERSNIRVYTVEAVYGSRAVADSVTLRDLVFMYSVDEATIHHADTLNIEEWQND